MYKINRALLTQTLNKHGGKTMRKILLIIILVISAAVVNTSCQKFGGTKEAFKAYKREAQIYTRAEYEQSRKVLKEFVGATAIPHIMSVKYELKSSKAAGDGQLNLEVVETIMLEHENLNGKTKLKNKHFVVMEKDENGAWESADVEIEEMD
jgi:hypothetical protein